MRCDCDVTLTTTDVIKGVNRSCNPSKAGSTSNYTRLAALNAKHSLTGSFNFNGKPFTFGFWQGVWHVVNDLCFSPTPAITRCLQDFVIDIKKTQRKYWVIQLIYWFNWRFFVNRVCAVFSNLCWAFSMCEFMKLFYQFRKEPILYYWIKIVFG